MMRIRPINAHPSAAAARFKPFARWPGSTAVGSFGLLFALLFLGTVLARAGHSPPKIFMRVYMQTNSGLPESEARPVQIPPDGEIIQVRTLPEVTEQELSSVETDATGAVHLHFDHVGQVDLDTATAENQGRIMIVMINDEIVYAPTIDTQLSNGELILPHPLTPLVVKLLQDRAAENNRRHKHI